MSSPSQALQDALRAILPPGVQGELLQLLSQVPIASPASPTKSVTIDSAAEDAGNTPATTLRRYSVMGLVDSSGKALPYAPDENDGRQSACGLLAEQTNMIATGSPADTVASLILQGTFLESQVPGLDPRARQQLARRILFQDNPPVADLPLLTPRAIYRYGTNHTVTAAESGCLLLATGAVTFTLPAKQNGLAYRFFQTANNDLTVQDGDSGLIARNNAAAASVAYSTSSQKIGSSCLVECCYVGPATLAWIFSSLCNHTVTVS